MTDADRAQALIEEEARIDRLAEAWQQRFDRWAAGNDTSPSTFDLALDACSLDPEVFEGCDTDHMADYINELLIDGLSLTDVATGLVEYAETFK